MSAHVLLNIIIKSRTRDQMLDMRSISSLYGNEFNKFNNAGARMLDFFYHIAVKLLWNCDFFALKV